MRPARPRDEVDLAGLIADAGAAGDVLAIEGGGSRASVGNPHVEGAIAVDLTAFTGVIDYEPTELVLTAYASTPLDEIESLLAANGQMLAFEPPRHGALCGRPDAAPTLAGAMAANASGSRRLSAGAARDHVLGFRAVSGRGEAFKAGGKVVKNVTGFDLCKLMAGSWGTLAVLTEVSVKVLPRPEYSATLMLSGLSPLRALEAMAKACGSPAPITGAAHLPAAVAARVRQDGAPLAATLLRLEGFEATVGVRLNALRALLTAYGPADLIDVGDSEALWRAIGTVGPLTPLPAPLWRVSAPAARADEIVRGLPGDSWMMDWAGGLIWAVGETPPPLVEAGAHRQLWAGRREAGTASMPPLSDAALRVTQALKAAFDPADILNRGRLGPPLKSSAT
jgi:glycolate oxidase FAD binding subunit